MECVSIEEEKLDPDMDALKMKILDFVSRAFAPIASVFEKQGIQRKLFSHCFVHEGVYFLIFLNTLGAAPLDLCRAGH